jgi:hypothetical protein
MSNYAIVSGTDGKYITVERAKRKENRYLKFRKDILKEKDPVRSQFFGREKLLELLAKPGCEGLKIIYGLDKDLTPSLIIAAASGDLKILTIDNTSLKGGDDNDYLALGPVCPRICQQ